MSIFQNPLTLFRLQDFSKWVLGLLGYYRSFVPAFANITLPITSLLKKSTPFVWSDKCKLALEYLNEIFCNKPLFLDPNKPNVLYTDASNNAYSGVLCQLVDNDKDIRPVVYFFRHIHSTKQELVCN